MSGASQDSIMKKTPKENTNVPPDSSTRHSASTDSDAAWEKMFGQLLDSYRQHKHFHVKPAKSPLAIWLARQRVLSQKGTLPDIQRQRLEFVGCPLKAADVAWEEQFASLREFHSLHGHCWVPANSTEYPALARWVATQVEPYRRRKLSSRCRSCLRQLQFGNERTKPRVILKPKWEKQFNQFADLCRLYGTTRIRGLLHHYPAVANWVKQMVDQKQRGTLHPLKLEKLARLGFWKDRAPKRADRATADVKPRHPAAPPPVAPDWDRRCAELAKFIRRHGDWQSAATKKETRNLYTWARQQGDLILNGQLPEENARKLQSIGFWGASATKTARPVQTQKQKSPRRPRSKKRITRLRVLPAREIAHKKPEESTIQCSNAPSVPL